MKRLFLYRQKSVTPFLGLFVFSAGLLLLIVASEVTVLTAMQELNHFWRTTYDILVRPTGARSPIEDRHGLVEVNHLSSISGGITITQYETIKAIPDVEVAAPIAMLGYALQGVTTETLGPLSRPGAYVVENMLTIDNGIAPVSTSDKIYIYIGPENPPGGSMDFALKTGIVVNPLFVERLGTHGYIGIPFLIAGVDPEQEATLLGLDRALVEGEYLTSGPVIALPADFGQIDRQAPDLLINLPSLINATPYISATLEASLRQLSTETISLQEILARGGKEYLDSLSGEVIGFQRMEGEAIYQRLLENLRRGFRTQSYVVTSLPAPFVYQELNSSLKNENPVLELVRPPSEKGWYGEPNYRQCDSSTLKAAFQVDVKGIFDITRIPQPSDVNRVPMETYFPPLVTLRYDEMGHPVEPRILRPTLNPCGYIQSPPLILTTLAAVCALRGDNCISAIRVRVGGID
ncbi:hypothetical protein, partial [Thermogutta sp.]|uniref:hypothetical protein n=1 Tax=Thermogutta sp. TaxID=1962930 RepID=UPI003220957B